MSSSKLIYKDSFKKNSYALIELGNKELEEAFESSDDIVIKGLVEDEAVLCTSSKTFIVRQVNTSNSLLLVEQDLVQERFVVNDDVSSTIELLPCLARLGRIDELLGDSRYSGYKNEEEIKKNKTLYTYHDLLSVVQASEKELLDGLRVRGAFPHHGFYRLLDHNYLFRLFDSLLTNATLHGLDFQKMTLSQAKSCIKEEMSAVDEDEIIEDNVLVASVNMLIDDYLTADVDDDKQLVFNSRKICRFLGEWVLSNPRNKRWELHDFMDVWKKLGQGIFIPQLEHIEGLYVTFETKKIQSMKQYIQYFPVSELSTDPPQRFAALFAEKPLWRSEEITPFLIDLAPNKKDREHLLLKFARTHREQKTTLYGSRIK